MKRPCLLLFVLFFCTYLFAQSNPVPLIYQPLNPASVPPGSPAFTLTVRGTGFVPGAVIKANGIALKTKFVNSSTLKATTPARAVAVPRTGSITVANPGTIDSNVLYFTVRKSSKTVAVQPDQAAIEGGQVVIGDFNNDRKPDLAVAWLNDNYDPAVGNADVYLNSGQGNYTKIDGPALGNGSDCGCLFLIPGDSAADVNNDGNLDTTVCIADGEEGENRCGIYLGDGEGHFTPVNSTTNLDQGTWADLNGDGILDYVDGHPDTLGGGFHIDVYLGNGDGTFTQAFRYQPRLAASVIGVPVVGDFNGDGKLDVAVSALGFSIPGPGTMVVLLGNGDGTLQSEVDYPTTYGGLLSAVADVNGDGKLDIVENGVSVLLGNGDGTFRAGAYYNVLPGFEATIGNVQIADVNGDGNLDVIVPVAPNQTQQTIDVLLGDGHGKLQSPIMLNSGPGQPFLGIADFNNDGLLDFTLSGNFDSSSSSTVLLQTPSK